MKYDVEKYKGKEINDLFFEYKELAANTVNKYYSRYINTSWK